MSWPIEMPGRASTLSRRTLGRLAILALRIVGRAQIRARDDPERAVALPVGEREGALRRLHREIEVSHQAVVLRHEGEDAGEPARIVERPGEPFGLPQQREDPLGVAQRVQGVAQLEPQIDRLLDLRAILGQVRRARPAPARDTRPPGDGRSAWPPWRRPGVSTRPPSPRARPASRDAPAARRLRAGGRSHSPPG